MANRYPDDRSKSRERVERFEERLRHDGYLPQTGRRRCYACGSRLTPQGFAYPNERGTRGSSSRTRRAETEQRSRSERRRSQTPPRGERRRSPTHPTDERRRSPTPPRAERRRSPTPPRAENRRSPTPRSSRREGRSPPKPPNRPRPKTPPPKSVIVMPRLKPEDLFPNPPVKLTKKEFGPQDRESNPILKEHKEKKKAGHYKPENLVFKRTAEGGDDANGKSKINCLSDAKKPKLTLRVTPIEKTKIAESAGKPPSDDEPEVLILDSDETFPDFNNNNDDFEIKAMGQDPEFLFAPEENNSEDTEARKKRLQKKRKMVSRIPDNLERIRSILEAVGSESIAGDAYLALIKDEIRRK